MSIFLRRGDLMLDISYYASLVRTESDKSTSNIKSLLLISVESGP